MMTSSSRRGRNTSPFAVQQQQHRQLFTPIRINPKLGRGDQWMDIAQVAKDNNVRLTKAEVEVLRQKLKPFEERAVGSLEAAEATAAKQQGLSSVHAFRVAGRSALERQWGREFCLTAVEQPTTQWDKWGSKLLFALDVGGKTLFAIVGTQMAGEAGMNLVGATLVGCISCLGGGTLNNLLYGGSPLLDRPGVNWVKNPTVFFVAVAASIFTFFTWPYYCHYQARQELRKEFDKHGELQDNDSVSRAAFVRACHRDPSFKAAIVKAFETSESRKRERPDNAVDRIASPNHHGLRRRYSTKSQHHNPHYGHHNLIVDENIDPEELFELVDTDASEYIEIDEMQFLVGHRFNASSTMYILDTLALSALSVTGVHMAIIRGLNPLVAATSGITICFGGISRDVLCGRHLAVGGQSYAMATGAGSAVYVLLRQMNFWPGFSSFHIPLVARIILSAGTTIAVRMLEFIRGEPLLRPMHYHPEHIHTQHPIPEKLQTPINPYLTPLPNSPSTTTGNSPALPGCPPLVPMSLFSIAPPPAIFTPLTTTAAAAAAVAPMDSVHIAKQKPSSPQPKLETSHHKTQPPAWGMLSGSPKQ